MKQIEYHLGMNLYWQLIGQFQKHPLVQLSSQHLRQLTWELYRELKDQLYDQLCETMGEYRNETN